MRHTPKAVTHINFFADTLIFEPRRIWTALTNAEKHGAITSTSHAAILKDLGPTAIHLARRDYVLRAAVDQLKQSYAALIDLSGLWALPKEDVNGILTNVVKGEAIEKERDRALLAVDSFLFEFRSYLELLAIFVYGILKGIGYAPNVHETLSSGESVQPVSGKGKLKSYAFILYLCDRMSMPNDWFTFLTEHRNFFTHEAAPGVAVEHRLVLPPDFDFLIMRVNIPNFAAANPRDYFRLSECTAVVSGVKAFGRKAQEYLVGMLEGKP